MKKLVIASVASIALTTACVAGAVPQTCVGCHGADGSRNNTVPASKPNTMKKADIVKALKEYRAGKRNKYKQGATMTGMARNLTDKQIQDIADAWGK